MSSFNPTPVIVTSPPGQVVTVRNSRFLFLDTESLTDVSVEQTQAPPPKVTTVVDSKPDAPVTVVTAPATAPTANSEVVVTTSAPLTQTQAVAIAPALQATQTVTSPPAYGNASVNATAPQVSEKRDIDTALLVLIAILLPPVSVYMVRGCGGQLAINIVLFCLLLWLPCFIHACYLIFHDDPVYQERKQERRVKKQELKTLKEEKKMAKKQEKLQAAQSQQALMVGN